MLLSTYRKRILWTHLDCCTTRPPWKLPVFSSHRLNKRDSTRLTLIVIPPASNLQTRWSVTAERQISERLVQISLFILKLGARCESLLLARSASRFSDRKSTRLNSSHLG